MKLNIRDLRSRSAAMAGAQQGNIRPLVLLYCGVLAALLLGSNGLNLYLNNQIDTTGGLSGLGLRAILQTVQEILTLVSQFFGPFWSAGFLFAMIRLVRGGTPQQRDMTEGFRRFFRILSAMAFEAVAAIVVLVAVTNLASIIFTLLPMGKEFSAAYGEVLSNPNLLTPEGNIDTSLVDVGAFGRDILPLLLMVAVIYLPIVVRMAYSFRMATYLILDGPIGAIPTHFLSAALMKGHKWSICKLDLSFWWYYLLGALCSAVAYLDMILALAGINVPVDPMVMFFATLAAYCVLFTLLSLWKKAEVESAYALAFEEIARDARSRVEKQ